MKRPLMFLAISGVVGIVLSIAFVAFITADKAMTAHAEQMRHTRTEREAKAREYGDCIREKYPMLTIGLFGGYTDERTGVRYDVRGTEQDKKCRARVYNR